MQKKKRKKKNCVSPTGTIHAVDYVEGKRVSTLCNHRNYFDYGMGGFYHRWARTNKPVTCKRCLKTLGLLKTSFTKKEVETLIRRAWRDCWTNSDQYEGDINQWLEKHFK